jgi:signal transduction histidine kinase
MPEAAGSVLPTLEQKVVEMAGMVDELLDTARIEEGRLDLRIENVELTRLVAGVVEGVRPLLSERHRLAVRPGSPVVVLADPRRARTIVANLVDNAVKYSPDGGVVEIAVKVREQHGVVEVADQGIGISDEQLKTMFQPFGRVVTSETSSIGGTGLGLHLSRELARLQDGDLELTSQPGAGTTARLLLPLDSLQAGQAGIG